MKTGFRFINVASLALGISLLAGCGGGGGGETIAVVNGEKITKEQFYAYLEAKPEVQVVLANGQVANATVSETLAFQALQDLIRQRVIVQLAKDFKLSPTDKEVEDEVKFQTLRQPEFVTALSARGLSLSQIRESLQIDLAREKLLTTGVEVSSAEVEKWIKDNRKNFTDPQRIQSKWIFVKDDAKKREVDRALNAGDSFTTIARRFSDDPNVKETLGQFQNDVVDNLPPAISNPLKATTVGNRTNWVKLSDGWAMFLVEGKQAEKYKAPSDTDRKWIKRQLAVQKGIQGNDLDRRLLQKLKGSKINVTYTKLVKPWEAAWEKIKEAEVTKSAEGAGTPAQ